MKRELSQAQIEAIRRHCVNGRCKMSSEERKERKKLYMERVKADPFRRAQYAAYFRKRRQKPEIHERTNAQNRARYNADIEKSRAYCREKYRRMMADPVRHAKYLARRRNGRKGADGKMTSEAKADQIKWKLIPLWERVVLEGRDDAYFRRARPENARLFLMWRDHNAMFNQMITVSHRMSKKK